MNSLSDKLKTLHMIWPGHGHEEETLTNWIFNNSSTK